MYSALGSANLKDDAHHHATEVLAAAALSRDLGTKLFRVKYAGDATSYPARLRASQGRADGDVRYRVSRLLG